MVADFGLARARKQSYRLIVPLTLLAFALWLASLAQRSIWVDELSTIEAIRQPDLQSTLQYVSHSERRPPLFFLLLRAWTGIAGSHEFSLRYFSLVFSVLSIPAAYSLARDVSTSLASRPRLIGPVTALLLAISPVLALYGVMVRYYSLVLCLSLALGALFLAWIRSLDKPAGTNSSGSLTLASTIVIAALVKRYESLARLRLRRRRYLLTAGWLAVAVLLVYTDYSVLALIGAQTIWLWFHRRKIDGLARHWVPLLVVLAIAYIPLGASLIEQVGRGKLEADLAQQPAGITLSFVYPLFSFMFGETILPWHLAVLAAAVFIGAAIVRALRASETRRLLAFVLLQVSLPLLFNVFLISSVATDLTFLTIASRTLFVLPFYLMMVAGGTAAMPEPWRRLTLALLGTANGAALVHLYVGMQYHNPIYAVPLREVAQVIHGQAKPGDLLIADWDIAFHYYWIQQPAPGSDFVLSDEFVNNAMADGSAQPPRVWLLSYGRDRTRVNDRTEVIRARLTQGYELVTEQGYGEVDPVYRAVKEWLLGREAYLHKLSVRLFARRH